jgi:hypothetical protein
MVAVKLILGAVLVCSSLTACGGPDPAPRAATVPSASAVMTDCGTFTLSQGDRVPDSAARCLVEAVRARHPARLKVTRPSTEGEPIPVTYTAGADGHVEVVTDSRQARFGTQEVTRSTCTEPVAAPELEFARCSEATPVTR